MVEHVQPVAHLTPVPIDRQRLAGKSVEDHQRDQFFRDLERTVIVGTVCGEHRQAIGMVPGAHQVVRRRLTGRIRTVRRVAVLLVECRRPSVERAVDFIRRDVQEAEVLTLALFHLGPVGPYHFQQAERPGHVGVDEGRRTSDRTVHMTFRRKVQHCADRVSAQQAPDQRAVADIAVHEVVARVARNACKIVQVAGIGQLVEVDDRLVMLRQPVEHEVGTNEAGTTGHKDGHTLSG